MVLLRLLLSLANTSEYVVKILSASCLSAWVPRKSSRTIPEGRSCSLGENPCFSGFGGDVFLCCAPKGQDTITSLLWTSNSSWFPLVILTAPCTIPRRVSGFSPTSFGEGFTIWIRKHVLVASTRVFAT